MKCKNLENLIKHIYWDIMQDDYDRYIEMAYGETEIIMSVFENEVPIKIHFEDVHFEDGTIHNKLTAELYVELCRHNIGIGWLKELDEICTVIEQNEEIFKTLLKGDNKNDKSSI